MVLIASLAQLVLQHAHILSWAIHMQTLSWVHAGFPVNPCKPGSIVYISFHILLLHIPIKL